MQRLLPASSSAIYPIIHYYMPVNRGGLLETLDAALEFRFVDKVGLAFCDGSLTRRAFLRTNLRPSPELNECIGLIWSDRVNTAKSVGLFCRCRCFPFPKTERAAVGAVLSDD